MKRRGGDLGSSGVEHIRRMKHSVALANQWIKGAVADGRRGACNAAMMSAATALEFAARAHQEYENTGAGRDPKPLRILSRARRVHRAIFERCLDKREWMMRKYARSLKAR